MNYLHIKINFTIIMTINKYQKPNFKQLIVCILRFYGLNCTSKNDKFLHNFTVLEKQYLPLMGSVQKKNSNQNHSKKKWFQSLQKYLLFCVSERFQVLNRDGNYTNFNFFFACKSEIFSSFSFMND